MSYDNTTNILTLSDGSGSNDCIYMQVNDPHHVKVVVMDAVSFDRCNTKNYDPWRDQPVRACVRVTVVAVAAARAWRRRRRRRAISPVRPRARRPCVQRCQGSMSAGTFVANKIAWLTKQA